MKIIVVQRRPSDRAGIRERIAQRDPKRAEEIFFTHRPEDVLHHMRAFPSELIVIVSGNVFDSNFFAFGSKCADAVKELNPKAAFYLYSTMPEKTRAMDGIIPRLFGLAEKGEHALLAEILTQKEEDLVPDRLKKLFPMIEWQL